MGTSCPLSFSHVIVICRVVLPPTNDAVSSRACITAMEEEVEEEHDERNPSTATHLFDSMQRSLADGNNKYIHNFVLFFFSILYNHCRFILHCLADMNDERAARDIVWTPTNS